MFVPNVTSGINLRSFYICFLKIFSDIHKGTNPILVISLSMSLVSLDFYKEEGTVLHFRKPVKQKRLEASVT